MSFDSLPDLTLFQVAVENSYDVVELLKEDATILYINSAVKRVLGIEHHTLVGTSHFALVHSDDKSQLQEELNFIWEHGQGEVSPYRCRTIDGDWRWIQSTVSRCAPSAQLSNSDAPVLILNSRDVTEQQEARQIVAKTNHQIHDIWESMSDAFFALDTQWRFTYMNRAAERVLERRGEDLLGRNVWDEFPAAIESLFFEQYNLAVNEQRAVTFEEFYPPLNTWFEVHAYPSEAGLAVYFCDINERRHTEEILRESEQRFRRIFEEGPMGIALVAPDTSLTHVNARMCEMLGYTEEELTSLYIADITHPEDRSINAHQTEQLLLGEISSYQMDKRYLTKEGRTVWTALTGAMIRDENNYPLYALAIVEDITERKQAQEKLHQSEANLARAQQMTGLGSWELDLSDIGDISSESLHWSDEKFRLFGYKPGQVEASRENFLRVVHPDDRERVATALERAIRGQEAYNLNYRIIWPDGSEHTIYAEADLIRDEASGAPLKLMGIGQDITQRIRDEEAQSRLVAIVESSEDAIMSKTLGGIITSWNQGAERIYGYSAEEAIGANMYTLLRPEIPAGELTLGERIRTGERVKSFETRCTCKDGRVIDVSISGVPLFNPDGEIVGISTITRDITAQKQAEVEREQSLVLLQATLESTADGILVVNEESKITHFNQQFVTMWRIPAEVLVLGDNTRLVELVKEQLVEPDEFEASAHVSSGEHKREGFDLLHFRDGRVFERYTKVQLLRNKEVGRVWSFRDITEKVRSAKELGQLNLELENRVAQRTVELAHKNLALQAEVAERQMAMGALREAVEMLEQAKQEAEQANRAKSEFLSRMSHELRTPMNAILGFGQLLEMSSLEENDRIGVEQILQAGRHLLQLINEVLEITRIETGHLSLSIESLEVHSMIREAINLVRPLAQQRRITLLNDIDESGALEHYVKGDKTRFHQVMLNLLSNAVKYNREGGSVTISLQEEGIGNEVLPNSLRIQVKDTGPGIAPEDQHKIFLPFERLGADTSHTEGTGIGLTLTKNLVELMGGEVGLHSEVGHGSTFWVELPATSKPIQPARAGETEDSFSTTLLPSLNRPLTFLYIEDNAFNVKLMEALLKKAPQVQLVTAVDGNTGLALARQRHFDLVLLDLHLPDMDGLDVLRQLQSSSATSGIPVIMVSANAVSSQINELLAAGARHYLTKPFGFKQFVQVVEDVLKTELP